VRALERDDASAIAHLMSAHPLWQARDSKEQSGAIARCLDRGEYGLVAELLDHDHRTLAGFVIMSDGTFGEHGYIRLIGARRELTGQGIGTRLLWEAERLFVHQGIRRVFLLCTDWNTAAQLFYERHGYVRVGALPDWLEQGVCELIYVKRDFAVETE
jgi:ribosomal protein S18 acetylase RimI-like enzyme